MIKEVLLSTILEADNSEELFLEYYEEGNTGLFPSHNVNKNIFYSMEEAGLTDSFALFYDNKLRGFIISSTTILPHYNTLVTSVTSIFISKEYRRHQAAKLLIKEVEKCAKERGSEVVLISSPIHSGLGRYSKFLGYKESNILYGKRL